MYKKLSIWGNDLWMTINLIKVFSPLHHWLAEWQHKLKLLAPFQPDTATKNETKQNKKSKCSFY